TPPNSSCTTCEEITFERRRPSPASTAAQVSSQLVSSARIMPAVWGESCGPRVGHVVQRAREGRGRSPHHERVLAVVLVIAAAHACGAEALALVQVDRDRVRAPDLEREAGIVVADTLVELGEQQRGEP